MYKMTKPKKPTFDPNEYQSLLQGLGRVDAINKTYEGYLENRLTNEDNSKIIQNLGKLVGNGGRDDHLIFNNVSDSGIQIGIDEQRTRLKQGLEAKLTQYQPNILDEYSAFHSAQISEMYAKQRKETHKKIDEQLKGKDKTQIAQVKAAHDEQLEREIYQLVGKFIRNLPMDEQYKEANKEVYALVKGVEQREKLRKQGRIDELIPEEVSARGLGEAYTMFPIARKWASEGDDSIYEAKIGQTFLKKTKTGYELNKEELAKYAGKNTDSYAAMAHDILVSKQKE